MKTLREILKEEKKRALTERLEFFGGNKSAAAKSLDMHYISFCQLIKRMGIHVERPEKVVKEKVIKEKKPRGRPRSIPSREELLSLNKLQGNWKQELEVTRKYEIKQETSDNHIKKYLEKLEEQRKKRIERQKPTLHWEDDPDFDTGYEQPTPEERDEWYNRDRF